MTAEIYPCYIKLRGYEEDDGLVEVPTQEDGSVLLSTVTGQFPKAIGLRFKSDIGSWRGICLDENNVMKPPTMGWGDVEYYVVRAKAIKRKAVAKEGPIEKLSKMTDEEILTDLIMLGLPYSASLLEIRKYFETFGELELCELKYDVDKKSRGFGFIRFKTVEAVKAVLSKEHVLHNRTIEVRFPKEDAKQDTVPTKVFIGRLPKGTTVEELRDHFSEYGAIKDVYIPEPFRGFGFVTFNCQSTAEEVMNSTHVIKGTYVNVSNPSTKKPKVENNESFANNWNNDGGGLLGNRPVRKGNIREGGNMSGYSQMQNMQQSGPSSLLGYGSGYGGGYFNDNHNYWGPSKPPVGNYGGWSKS